MSELAELVNDMANGIMAADALRPQAQSQRGTRTYQPGIGPHSEDAAVRLALRHMKEWKPTLYGSARPVAYPGSRRRCDIGIGEPLEWAIEVKMARAYGDNGRLDDTYLKDLLSPYESDHSALTDARKLLEFNCRRAILVYGFDYPDRALQPAVDALELLMSSSVRVGPRDEAAFVSLIHPVHKQGRVLAWEVLGLH